MRFEYTQKDGFAEKMVIASTHSEVGRLSLPLPVSGRLFPPGPIRPTLPRSLFFKACVFRAICSSSTVASAEREGTVLSASVSDGGTESANASA